LLRLQSNLTSEAGASGKLDLPWTVISGELAKVLILEGIIHAGEQGVVKYVIEFTSQLKRYSLLNGNVLKQSHVPIIEAWSTEYDFAGIANEI